MDKKIVTKKYIQRIIFIFILFFNLSLAYANINTAEAIWGLKNFEKQNTNAQTTEDWNKQNINSPIIQYGNIDAYENNIKALSNPNANINNFEPTTLAIGAYILYKAIESSIETGVEYGIAELTDDQEFNPLLSFGKNIAINSTIGLIPGTSQAKLTTKAAIYFGKLTLRTAGDTAVDAITRDGDTQDYVLNNAVSNIVADNFSVLVKKYGGKVINNVLENEGTKEIVRPPRSIGAAANTKTLQTGGHTLNKRTLKEIGLSKQQGKKAIEGLKKDIVAPPSFHETKILSNGDVINSNIGNYLGNLFDYLP